METETSEVTTYEVRVVGRDGNIRPYEFLDRDVAVKFAVMRGHEEYILGVFRVTREKMVVIME